MRDAWTIAYELRSDACAKAAQPELAEAVLAAGAHPEMRVVRFGMDVSFAGGAPSSPAMLRWPEDEQQRYRREQGFAARPSIASPTRRERELTWFSSLQEPDGWTSRLRDERGTILLSVETDLLSPVVWERGALYWRGGRLR